MKTYYFLIALILSGCMLLTSCSKDDDPTDTLIDPANADALSKVLILPDGTQRENGAPPPPTNTTLAPTVDNNNSNVLSSNGSTAPLNFEYGNVSGNLGGCYVQVDGAGSYFTVPYNAASNSSGQLQLPLGIPTNVDEGDFCVNFCVYDDNGLVSNIVTSCISVLRLGTGALQISLSWNNSSDQDLYVEDPTGTTIYYINDSSISGGQLDRDDTDGYGPENIFWTDDAPDGTYTVSVNDYEGTSTPTTFYVTINAPGISRSFTGSTVFGNTEEVVSFTKNGSNLTF